MLHQHFITLYSALGYSIRGKAADKLYTIYKKHLVVLLFLSAISCLVFFTSRSDS